MISIDFSKQQATDADPKVIQEIDFTANLDEAGNRTIYLIIEELKEIVLNFLTRNCERNCEFIFL